MKTNRTSKVAEQLANLKPIGNVRLHVPCDMLIAIGQKYQKMEEVLSRISTFTSWAENDESVALANEALSLDPLPPTE